MGFRARVLMWGLFVGAAAAALAPAGPGALIPLKMAIASADSIGNDVYVAVVVDFGNGSSMTTVSKCVPVPSNAHDADALAEAVGSSDVAYSGSGLLCAIDDYPTNGVQNCGQSVGNGNYDYWSYWHGASGSWVYASNGPAEQSASSPANDVEGLRFQSNEPASSSDPTPSITPSYAQICNASTEVPPAQTPAPATTTTTPSSSTPPLTPTTAKAGIGGFSSVTTTSTAVSTRAKSSGSGASTTTTAQSGTTTTSTTGGSTGPEGGSRGSSVVHRSAAASATASSHAGSGGGPPTNLVPVVVIAVVVAALGGFALFRWRRRPAEE